MKTSSVFKMKKQTKVHLALSKGDAHHLGMLKRMFIKAQVAEESAVHTKPMKESE